MLNLTPIDLWMVRENVKYAQKEGLEPVVARLRAQGYVMVADAVTTVMSRAGDGADRAAAEAWRDALDRAAAWRATLTRE